MAFPKVVIDEELKRGAAALAALGEEKGWIPALGDMFSVAGPEMLKAGKESVIGAGRGAKELIKQNTQLDELYRSLFEGSGKPSGLQIRKRQEPIAPVQEEVPYGPETPPPNTIDLAAILRAATAGESPMFQMGAFDVGKNSKGSFSRTKTNGRDWSAINDEMQRIRLNSRPTINDNSIRPEKREELMAEMVKAQHYAKGQEGRGDDGDRERVAMIRGLSEIANNESLTPDRLQLALSLMNMASGGKLNLDQITEGLGRAKQNPQELKGDSGYALTPWSTIGGGAIGGMMRGTAGGIGGAVGGLVLGAIIDALRSGNSGEN